MVFVLLIDSGLYHLKDKSIGPSATRFEQGVTRSASNDKTAVNRLEDMPLECNTVRIHLVDEVVWRSVVQLSVMPRAMQSLALRP